MPLSDPRVTPERLDACAERFGQTWGQMRESPNGREVRLKPLNEYRHLLEEPGRFMLMTGEEITAASPEGRSSFINLYNAHEALAPVRADDRLTAMQAVVRSAEEQARVSGRRTGHHLNHPNWEWNTRAEEIAQLDGLKFMEMFTALGSTNCHGDELHASSERIWDIVLSLRLGKLHKPAILGIATDDAHDYDDPHSTSPRAWVMVRAQRLTPESIIDAMERGDFYASTGVTLTDVTSDGGKLSLEIGAEPSVNYRTEFVGALKDVDLASTPVLDEQGDELRTTRRYSGHVGRLLAQTDATSADYTLTGNELYVRARVTSDKPHPLPHRPGDVEMAWTQPVTPGG